MMTTPCDSCGGTGQIPSHPCKKCGTTGVVRQKRTLKVNIPAGMEHNSSVRLANQGEAGMRGGPPGHLYLRLSVCDDHHVA